jgi:hypothetical protein
MLKKLKQQLKSSINVSQYMPYIMEAIQAIAKYFGYNVNVTPAKPKANKKKGKK